MSEGISHKIAIASNPMASHIMSSSPKNSVNDAVKVSKATDGHGDDKGRNEMKGNEGRKGYGHDSDTPPAAMSPFERALVRDSTDDYRTEDFPSVSRIFAQSSTDHTNHANAPSLSSPGPNRDSSLSPSHAERVSSRQASILAEYTAAAAHTEGREHTERTARENPHDTGEHSVSPRVSRMKLSPNVKSNAKEVKPFFSSGKRVQVIPTKVRTYTLNISVLRFIFS